MLKQTEEPLMFSMVLLFIVYSFSEETTYREWWKKFKNRMTEIFNEEYHYQKNYVIRYLCRVYKEEFTKAGVFRIRVRKSDKWYIYLHHCNRFNFDNVQMEYLIGNELNQFVEIITFLETK